MDCLHQPCADRTNTSRFKGIMIVDSGPGQYQRIYAPVYSPSEEMLVFVLGKQSVWILTQKSGGGGNRLREAIREESGVRAVLTGTHGFRHGFSVDQLSSMLSVYATDTAHSASSSLTDI